MSYTITQECNGCTACTKTCPTRAISGVKNELHKVDPFYCVECGVCGRICPQNAVLDQDERRCTMVKRNEWPKPKVVGDRCISCNICVEICPFKCLELQITPNSKEKRALPVLIKAQACVACNQCALSCPTNYLKV